VIERVRGAAVSGAYRAGWAVTRWVPERVAYAAFQLAADLLWLRRGAVARRYERNIAPVLGPAATEDDLRRVSRAGLRSYLRYWCVAFRLSTIDREEVVRRTRVEHAERLLDPLRAGRGLIAALPHLANWDHAGAWACAMGLRVTAVAERLRPESLFDRFVAYRESLGMEIIALAGAADPFPTLAERVRGGGLVTLVADRDMTARGIEVTLCGARTRMPAGPAALALRTGCDLVPVTLWYDGPHLALRVHESIGRPDGLHGRDAVAAMTQSLADVFSAALREHPEDWHMLQRFWLDDRPPGPARGLDESASAAAPAPGGGSLTASAGG
jgi:KDO2-lipid IV(A) lauroyltransferase